MLFFAFFTKKAYNDINIYLYNHYSMVNKKILWLSALLSLGAVQETIASPKKTGETNKNKSEMGMPIYQAATTIDIMEVLWNTEKTTKKENLFKNFSDPSDLIDFYRKNISDNKKQPQEYRKMWKKFDKVLVDVVKFNNTYQKEQDMYFYTVPCPLTAKDTSQWIHSIIMNVSVEKFSKDEDVYLPKIYLTKTYKNGVIVHLVLKPELSVTRDRRAYVGNEKRDNYQVLLIEFTLEWYSEQNKNNKKTIYIQSTSKMNSEIKEFQNRINMAHKEKQKKEKEERISQIKTEKTKEQEETIEKKLQKRQSVPQRNYNKDEKNTAKKYNKIHSKEKKQELRKKNKALIKKILQHNQEAIKKNKQLIKELIQQNITTPPETKPPETNTIIPKNNEVPIE